MRSYLILGTLLALSFTIGSSPARSLEPRVQPPKGKPLLPTGHELMLAKLKSSQKLLEGLALSDFKAIAASGDELAKISQDAEFLNALKTDDYRIQMMVFRRSAETLAKRAREKNLDGATLAYMDMTLTCVKCHQTTRDRSDARRPLPPDGAVSSGVKPR